MESTEGDMQLSVSTDETGQFCAMLRPGKYTFTVSGYVTLYYYCTYYNYTYT